MRVPALQRVQEVEVVVVVEVAAQQAAAQQAAKFAEDVIALWTECFASPQLWTRNGTPSALFVPNAEVILVEANFSFKMVTPFVKIASATPAPNVQDATSPAAKNLSAHLKKNGITPVLHALAVTSLSLVAEVSSLEVTNHIAILRVQIEAQGAQLFRPLLL